MNKKSYIMAVVHVPNRCLYIPEPFPRRSSQKQIAAVCRDFLNMEVPDWQEADITLSYYEKNAYKRNKRLYIKKGE